MSLSQVQPRHKPASHFPRSEPFRNLKTTSLIDKTRKNSRPLNTANTANLELKKHKSGSGL
jgi:hypothetical protein